MSSLHCAWETRFETLLFRQPENAKVRTIEGTLFDALVKVGAVSQDNADDPVKVTRSLYSGEWILSVNPNYSR